MIVFNPNKIRRLITERRNVDKQFRQTDFLKEVKLSLPGLNNILEGKSVPGVDTLIRIANYFGKDLNFFCDLEETVIQNTDVNVTDANEYLVNRFEEVIIENSQLKIENKRLNQKLEEYTSSEPKEYSVQNVQTLSVAEKPIKLKKP